MKIRRHHIAFACGLAALFLAAYFFVPAARAQVTINGMTVTSAPHYGIPKTGQETCYDAGGTPISCSGSGNDAEYADPAGSYDIGYTRGEGSWANWNAAGHRFTDNGDGTTTDNATGLMWVKSGYADTDTTPATTYTADGSWRTYTWANALLYCERLDYAGYTDWRLPNIKELLSIVDYGADAPSIDTNFFTNTKSNNHWSSTTGASAPTFAWYVGFSAGNESYNTKTTTYYVRPVRRGQ
jgi:hypothetical protein